MCCGRPIPPATPRLSHASKCLNSVKITDIHLALDPKCRNHVWVKIFSASSQRRSLLNTYYRRYTEFEELCNSCVDGCMSVVRDKNGAVFGCCTSYPWTEKSISVVENGVFVFKVEDDETKIYNLRSGEDIITVTLSDCISVDEVLGTTVFEINSSLEDGFSSSSYSFGSPQLSSESYFDVETIEFYFVVPFRIHELWADRTRRE